MKSTRKTPNWILFKFIFIIRDSSSVFSSVFLDFFSFRLPDSHYMRYIWLKTVPFVLSWKVFVQFLFFFSLFLSIRLSVSPSSLRSALLKSIYLQMWIKERTDENSYDWIFHQRDRRNGIHFIISFAIRSSVEIPWQRAIQSDDVIYYIPHGFSSNEIFRQCSFFRYQKIVVRFFPLAHLIFFFERKRKREQWQR